jgi:hypothetical protein
MTMEQPDDVEEFVIASVSRGDVRAICGDEAVDRLTDEDMRRLAEEMAESYVAGTFVDDLQEIIDCKFS